MPTRALAMRKLRELIRLKYEVRLSHEQIARALSISKGVVAKYVSRLEHAGADPARLASMSERDLAAVLLPASRPESYGGRVLPDFAHLHIELKRPGVNTAVRHPFGRTTRQLSARSSSSARTSSPPPVSWRIRS